MSDPPPAKKRRVADLLCGDQPEPAEVVPDEDAHVLTADGSWAAAEAITKQIPTGQVPLTILTGFLGAGKSTVLNYILKSDHGLRIAVLINEFGDVDIDNQLVDTKAEGAEGDPIQLNNGCVCCTISNGFIDAVQKILDRPGEKPHYFILETSGVADPKPIIDSVGNTELREDLYVDQVLTVVDSSSWTPEHYDSDTAAKQLQFADTVLLSKTDLVQEEKLKLVLDDILDIRPNTRVLKSQKGYVPIAALFDLDIAARMLEQAKKEKEEAAKTAATADGKEADGKADGKADSEGDAEMEGKADAMNNSKMNANEDGKEKSEENANESAKENDKGDGHAHSKPNGEGETHKHGEENKEKSSCGHKHAPGEKCGHSHKQDENKKVNHLEQEGFSSLSFVSNKSFSLNRFRNEFMEDLPNGVFRAKGLLWFRNYPQRFVFHWSGQRYNVEEDEWPEGVTPNNQLVIIGRNLDKALIEDMLENCITRPGDEEEDFEDEDEEDEDMYGDDGMEGESYPPGGPDPTGMHNANAIPNNVAPNGLQPYPAPGAAGAPLEPIAPLQTPLPALAAPIPGVGPALMPPAAEQPLPGMVQGLPQPHIELAALQNAPPQNPAQFSLPHIGTMPAMAGAAPLPALDGGNAFPALNGGNLPAMDMGALPAMDTGKLPAFAPMPAVPASAVAEPAVEAPLPATAAQAPAPDGSAEGV